MVHANAPRLTILVLAVACLSCGEKSPQGTAPWALEAPAQKEGWQTIKSAGFGLSVPQGWAAIDLTSGDMEEMLATLGSSSATFRQLEEQVRDAASAGAIKLFVFHEIEGETEFAENLNVVVTEVPSAPTLGWIETGCRQELSRIIVSGSSIRAQPIDLPAGKAMRFQSRLDLSLPQVDYVASLAYIFGKGKRLFVVTFSSKPEREEKIVAEADEIMRTFVVN